jgi:hypothetical protein
LEGLNDIPQGKSLLVLPAGSQNPQLTLMFVVRTQRLCKDRDDPTSLVTGVKGISLFHINIVLSRRDLDKK